MFDENPSKVQDNNAGLEIVGIEKINPINRPSISSLKEGILTRSCDEQQEARIIFLEEIDGISFYITNVASPEITKIVEDNYKAQKYINETDKLSMDNEGNSGNCLFIYCQKTDLSDENNSSNKIEGVARIITGLEWDNFPFYRDFEHALPNQDLNPSQCLEVGRLAVDKSSTRSVPINLYRQIIQHSIKNNIDTWIMTADIRLFKWLQIIGFPLEVFGDEKLHMGSLTIPCVCTKESLEKEGKPGFSVYLLKEESELLTTLSP